MLKINMTTKILIICQYGKNYKTHNTGTISLFLFHLLIFGRVSPKILFFTLKVNIIALGGSKWVLWAGKDIRTA